MDAATFFMSPLGWVFIAVLFAIALVTFRAMTVAVRQRSVVYHALLEEAKKQAHKKISLIITLRRRADSLRPLFEHLAAHSYDQLELVVIVYQTAGKAAEKAAQALGREYGIPVKTIKHKKGMTVDTATTRRATGDLVLRIQASTRFSYRFFEKVSFAFVQPIAATKIRNLVQVNRTLMSAFWAATRALQQLIAATFRRSESLSGLSELVIVRRDVLTTSTPYSAKAELYDEFAISVPFEAAKPTWRAAVALAALITPVVILVSTTALDLLLYVSALIFAVLLITTEVTLMQQTGPNKKEKMAMFFIVPFLPAFAVLFLSIRSLQWSLTAIRNLVQRQLGRKKRPTPRVRTQAKRLSI